MSEENLETARRCYESFKTRDYAYLTEVVDPDAVFDVSRNVFNPGVHRGIEGFRQFIAQTDEMWERFAIEPQELIDAGDRVLARVRVTGVGRGSGVEVDMQVYNVWTFRDGMVLSFEGGFRDRSEASEAARLPEG